MTVNSPDILGNHATISLFIGVTEVSMEISDHNDTTIPIDTIKVISEITHDQLVASKIRST